MIVIMLFSIFEETKTFLVEKSKHKSSWLQGDPYFGLSSVNSAKDEFCLLGASISRATQVKLVNKKLQTSGSPDVSL